MSLNRFLNPGRRLLYAAAPLLAALALAPAGALAASNGTITEYGLPSPGTQPQRMCYSTNYGFYWMAGFMTDQLIRILPTNHSIKAYSTPTHPSHPYGIVALGTNIWFTESYSSKIGLLYTNVPVGKGDHTFVEFPVHATNNSKIPCGPAGLTLGPDSNLWFVESQTNKIGCFILTNHPTLSNFQIIEYSVPWSQTNSQFYNIITGPDGNLWYTDTGAGKICAFNPSSQTVAVMALSTNSEPVDIIVGPDNAIWFSEFNASSIGRLATSCFSPSNFTGGAVYTNSQLYATNYTNNGIYTQVFAPTNSENTTALTNAQPLGMTVGPDGNIWFAEYAGSRIDRVQAVVTTNGTNYVLTQFATPTGSAKPIMLTGGGDTNIWFGEYAGNAVAKLVLDHYPLLWTDTNPIISYGTNFSGMLATFIDTDPTNGPGTNYIAFVQWGDGSTNLFTTNSPATNAAINVATNSASGGFRVNGSHKYTNSGIYNITLTITDNATNHDAAGESITATIPLTIVPPSTNAVISLTPASGGSVILSWPNSTNLNGYVLQENTNLMTTNWTNVAGVTNREYIITNGAPGQGFFRLKKP